MILSYRIGWRRLTLIASALLFPLATGAHAGNIIWTGDAGNNSLFDAANYSVSYNPATDTYGPSPATGPVQDVAYGMDVQFTDAGNSLGGYTVGFGGFSVGDGNTACFQNSGLDRAGTTGGIRQGLYEFFGSTSELQYLSPNTAGTTGVYYFDGSSSMTLTGGGNPLNTSIAGTAVEVLLDQGASLSLTNAANFTTNQNNGDKIFFANASGVVKSVNDHLADAGVTSIGALATAGFGTFDAGTSTFTAAHAWGTAYASQCPISIPVPEPQGFAMAAAFGLLACRLIRRRR